jgi:hypothetical protein
MITKMDNALRNMERTRIKSKGEIIINDLEKLKVDIIILMEKRRRIVDWKSFVDLFIFIVEYLKRNEQGIGFLQF